MSGGVKTASLISFEENERLMYIPFGEEIAPKISEEAKRIISTCDDTKPDESNYISEMLEEITILSSEPNVEL